MKQSVRKNLGMQILLELLNICTPFITAPFLARRLGASQLGVFSYTSSIAIYFALFAILGTANYGTRSIASCKEDRLERSRIFWEIFALQLTGGLFAMSAYVVYLSVSVRENQLIAWLQLLEILSRMSDITWLFFGLEEFRYTVRRSVIIKLLTVVLVLLLVKETGDLWIYTSIMLGGRLFSQLILYVRLPSCVTLYRPKLRGILSHIRPNLALFVPILAMSVYHAMDKTMLGLLSTYEQSGFYYNADKVISIPLGITNGVTAVLLPRTSMLLSEGKKQEADRLFLKSLEGISVLFIALALGAAAVSPEFIPFFYGPGYGPCVLLVMALAPVYVFKSISAVARIQYMVPMRMEHAITWSVLCGALVNLILNLLLIPRYEALGAAAATMLSEFYACIFQLAVLKRHGFSFEGLIKRCGMYLAGGVIMVIFVRISARISDTLSLQLLMEILTGFCVYGLFLALFWRKKSQFRHILFSVFSQFHKNKD